MQVTAIDFEQDVRDEIIKYLPHNRNDQAEVDRLRALPTDRLLTYYLNWRDRLIHTRPRSVLLSRELTSRSLYAARRKDVENLLAKMRSGGDLNPHLSERILDGYIPRDKKNPLRDNRSLDLLLNDWNMHHLHISQGMKSSGFVERDDPLLIVIIRDDIAFVVDLVVHGSWSDQSLVEIVVENWPKANLFVRLSGVTASRQSLKSSERSQLRRAGLATHIEINGELYIPATGGISTAGTSTRAAMAGNAIRRTLNLYERDPALLVKAFETQADFAGTAWPEYPDFRFRFIVTSAGFGSGILETTTGKAILV